MENGKFKHIFISYLIVSVVLNCFSREKQKIKRRLHWLLGAAKNHYGARAYLVLLSTTSVWRVLSTEKHWPVRRQNTVYRTQTRVYSERGKCIVRHWTSREATLRHSSGWGTWSVSPQYRDLRTRGIGYRGRRVTGISGSLIWSKTLMELIFNLMVNFDEVRSAQLAKSTLLTSMLVPLGPFQIF